MRTRLRDSLLAALCFTPIGLVWGAYVFSSTPPAGVQRWSAFPVYSGLAFFLAAFLIWYVGVARPPRPDVLRGLVAGLVISVLALPLATYLRICGNWLFVLLSVSPVPPGGGTLNPVRGLWYLLMSFWSFIWMGWITIPVGAGVGTLVGYWQERAAPDQYEEDETPRRRRKRPTRKQELLVGAAAALFLIGSVVLMAYFLWWRGPNTRGRYEDQREYDRSRSNLRQIALAMHNYDSATGRFPMAKVGKGLSWRVALLPYLEQENLYRQFKLDEPWDSPHNLKLLDQMPRIYTSGASAKAPKNSTFFQVFTGPGTLFPEDQGVKIAEVRDGTANTFLIVEASRAVPWTQPEDIPFDPEQLPQLGAESPSGFLAAFADGSIRVLPRNLDRQTLKALITISGGEKETPR